MLIGGSSRSYRIVAQLCHASAHVRIPGCRRERETIYFRMPPRKSKMNSGAFKPHNPGPSSLRKQRNADADAADEPDAGSRANERPPPVAPADTHTTT